MPWVFISVVEKFGMTEISFRVQPRKSWEESARIRKNRPKRTADAVGTGGVRGIAMGALAPSTVTPPADDLTAIWTRWPNTLRPQAS